MVTVSITSKVKHTTEDMILLLLPLLKEGMKVLILHYVPIFHEVEESLIDVVQQGHFDLLLKHSVYKLAESDRFMDASAPKIVQSHDLIWLVAQFVKSHIIKKRRVPS